VLESKKVDEIAKETAKKLLEVIPIDNMDGHDIRVFASMVNEHFKS
jgi:hypothetical protein